MKKKLLISILSALVIVGGTLAVAGACRNNDEKANNQLEQNAFTGEVGMVLEEGETQGSGVLMTGARINREQYAAYGVSPQTEMAYTVTATITPEYLAASTELVWSAEFQWDRGWPVGKDVNDYIKVSTIDDLAHQAVIECIQPFDSPIIVKAALKGNAGVFATCSCTYITRYDTVNADLEDGTRIVFDKNNVTNFSFEASNAGKGRIIFTGSGDSAGSNNISWFGLSMRISDALAQSLSAHGFTLNSTAVDYGAPLYAPQIELSMYGYDTMLYLPGADADIVGTTQSNLIKQGYLWATTGTDEDGVLSPEERDAYSRYQAALLAAWNESDDFLVTLILKQYKDREDGSILRTYEAQMDIDVTALFPLLITPTISIDYGYIDF